MTISNKTSSKLEKNITLDYKDIDTLRKYINEQGKILSRRLTGLTPKKQKQVTKSIKRARMLALLPFLHKD